MVVFLLTMKKLMIYSNSINEPHFFKQEIILEETGLANIYRLGRSPVCEISIDWCGHFLSSFQFTLTKYSKETEYSATDGLPSKPSRNGTWLNGNRMDRKLMLQNGDRLVCAGGALEIEYISLSTRSRLADDLEETLSFER